jgi:hypothetical protein
MSMTQTWTANPSVDLPTYGRAFGMPACAQVDTRMCAGVAAIEGKTAGRTHVTSLASGIVTRAKDVFPGNPAWSPPIC